MFLIFIIQVNWSVSFQGDHSCIVFEIEAVGFDYSLMIFYEFSKNNAKASRVMWVYSSLDL